MKFRALRHHIQPLTPPFRLGLVLIYILQFLVVTPAAAFHATDASTSTPTPTGTTTPLLPTGSAEPTATPTLTPTPLASTAVPTPTETILSVPVGEVSWLSTPASPAELASNQPFVFLAGSLINAGMVDISACTSGALLANGAATACGLEKARYQVYLWQNQFDPAIYQASRASGVPAYLLKNVFARESQFWPATIQNQGWNFGEYGLGQLNEKGADTLLMWNGAYFNELCQATFNQQTCWRGYVNLSPDQQALLRGLALSQVRVDCPSCAYRLDLVRTEASVKVFAQTLVADRNQVLQVLRNLTGTNSIGATSYADLWKFTLVNYHSGPGCLNAALGKTRAADEKIQWKFVRKHFDLTCQAAVNYVEVITYVAPLGNIPQAPEPTPTATLTPSPEPTLTATFEPTSTTTPDLTLIPAETAESATPTAETALPTATSDLPTQEASPSAEVTAAETATALPGAESTATATVQAEPTATPVSTAQVTPEAVPGEFVADEIIVKFKGFPTSLFAGAVLNGVSAEILSEDDALGTLLVKVPAGQLSETLTELRSNLLVSYAEPNYAAHAFFTPNDPGFVDQAYLETLQVPAAWEVTQGEGVVVAVIDTGVDASHPDLAGSLWVNPGETGTDANENDKRTNGLDDDDDGYVDDWQGWNTIEANPNIQDDQGHGTHLAGIIAARMNNSQGFAGIAPQAQIMVLKALDANGFGTYAQVAEAISYAADHGAKIINIGFGGESPSNLLQAAIDYAQRQGVLVIASSGNSGDSRLIYPAAYPNVISVGAVDQNLSSAAFSTFGESLDLVALGVGIQASLPGNTYGALSGTSMSVAQVSGIAALIASQPQFGTASKVREALEASALDLDTPGWDAETGNGLPRALAALNFIPNGTPTPTNTLNPASPSPTPGGVDGVNMMAIGTSTAWTRAATGTAGPYTITNAAFSCSAGSNRLLIAVVTGEVGTAAAANVTATKGAGINFTSAIATASARGQVWIGYLTEAQINGNTNSISITNSSGQAWTGSDVYLGCYNNVDQTQPLVTGGTWRAASNTAAPTSSLSIPVVNGGVIVYGNYNNNAGPNSVTETAVNPVTPAWVERFDVAGTGYASMLAEKLVTATTTPVTTTFNWTSRRYANAAISLNPGAFSTTTPILTSPSATAITDLTATLGATISTQGGAAITERGTCWGATASPTTNCAPEGGTTLGAFSQVRTGLPAGTLVYYRGYATNSFGTAYSPDGSFYTEPTTQASAVSFTTVSSTSLTVNWTRGSGSGVLVLMKAAAAVDANPADGIYTTYTANTAFAGGTQLGTGNYVIFKGAGTSVTITGLTVGTTYFVAVYEYAGAVDTAGLNQGTNYKLTPATGSKLMTAPPLIQSPVVAISSPAAGASFVEGTKITFIGSATIPTNADVSSGLVWTEGASMVGNGASFGLQTLSAGAHTITASYTDVYGRNATTSVTVTITAATANPHNAYLATTDKCAFCHRAHTDRSDRLIDYCPSPLTADNFCLSCHKDPNSTLTPTCATVNGPVSEKIVSTHSNKEWPGSSSSAVEAPFEVRCIQCHNPHGSSNLFDIRPDVRLQQSPAVVTSGPVVFTTLTGTAPNFTNSFDEVDPAENAANNADDLCVTCHINPSNTPGMTNHNGGIHLAGADYRGLDCTTCHPHSLDSNATTKDGFMTGCRACHNKPQDNGDNQPVGGRRQIVGATGGDFTRSSHHVNGADTVTNTDCQICHEMSQHKAGTVKLRNVDTGTAYTLNYTTLRTTPTQTDSDAYEAFCISCHDSNGRAGDTTPFSDQKLVPAVSNLWSPIFPVPARHNGTFTPFLGSCLDCHDSSHGSNKLKLLDLWNYTGDGTAIDPMQQEEKFCYSCHTTTPGRPVAAAFSAWTNTANRIFEHDVSKADTGLEHGKEVFGTSFANRHVECGDCHEPHKDAYPNTATAPAIKLAQRGASGVEPVFSGAGAATSFNFQSQAANEYQVCFKCHSNYTTLPTYKPDGWGCTGSPCTARVYLADGLRKLTNTANPCQTTLDTTRCQVLDPRDLAKTFNPANGSYHPVLAAGKNAWNLGFATGWSTSSRVYCSDCHTNANGTVAASQNGPHGSPLLHILAGNVAGSGTNYSSTSFGTNAANVEPTVLNTEVCFKCHNYATYVSGASATNTHFRDGTQNLHYEHMRKGQFTATTCYTCHNSHGSEQQHLINFDIAVAVPEATYNSQTAWQWNGTTGSCYVTCHSQAHTPKSYTP